jgi:hypothetical protein
MPPLGALLIIYLFTVYVCTTFRYLSATFLANTITYTFPCSTTTVCAYVPATASDRLAYANLKSPGSEVRPPVCGSLLLYLLSATSAVLL